MTPQGSLRDRQNFVHKLLCPRLKKIAPRAAHRPCKIAEIGETTQETAMQCEEAQSLDTARPKFSILNRTHSSISTDLIHKLESGQNCSPWMTEKHPVLGIKVNLSNSVTHLNVIPIYWGVSGQVWLQEQIPKRRVFQIDWTNYFAYGNHSINMIGELL